MSPALVDFRRSANALRFTTFLLLALPGVASPVSAAKVSARTGQITLPTYGWAANKHPHFRGTDGKNIYPYPMLDFLSRDKTNRTYRTVILENEYLRITFLPELGGKIHEVLDKTTGQPMFYVNHVIKPGLIGQCGAWTSGGVEWNTGPQGHTVSCMQPVHVVILPPEKDGSRSVAIGETERIYRTKWTVVITLRPGRSFIEERIRIYNPTETVRPYYFWNCTAVPNTPGFRFIYPMTFGCDHAGEKFFNWPVDNGKDLTRGTNYQDASSIFAWHCDQDFFGSYNDDLGRGVVAYANHHQLPGKKAWTWGHGGFGKMHQMDLTDDNGPYNEVQTGPLLTQAQVGRLDPCEAVEWKEWWYPIHGLGGFTFANKDVAVNASTESGRLQLRVLGTGTWSPVEIRVAKETAVVARAQCKLAPKTAVRLDFVTGVEREPFEITVATGAQTLAQFRVPLDLPMRTPPEKKPVPQTASEIAESGWREFLFAQFPEARKQFYLALEKDTKCVSALLGLAFVHFDDCHTYVKQSALAVLELEPHSGLAAYALAVEETKLGQTAAAMDHAWKAALDPATAVPACALVAKLLLRRGDWAGAVEVLSASGPWQTDVLCQDLLALALVQNNEFTMAKAVADANLVRDPLDHIAMAVPFLCDWEQRNGKASTPDWLKEANDNSVLSLAASLLESSQPRWAGLVIGRNSRARQSSTTNLFAAYLQAFAGCQQMFCFVEEYINLDLLKRAKLNPSPEAFPYLREMEPAFHWALRHDPNDGQTRLYLGHLLFHLGRHAEGRAMWKRAAELGAEPAIAYRALGMAAKTLDNDLPSARGWLTKANQADPKDSIVARDLANVLFALADKAGSDAEKRALATEARDRLKAAFAEGKGRSDFVALLARAQNRLDEFAETARMLDTVRVTIWEGAHEVHDLFVQSHLALGEAHLKAGRAAEALAEFNRALEYPVNLATGKLENAREAHIHFARGNAFAALDRKQEATTAWKHAADEPESKDAKIEEARKKAKEALERVARE